jgi:alpha-glucosidase
MERKWLRTPFEAFCISKRPFIITRSAYAGTQRYSSSWTGDNVAREHLWIANIQVQRMSISEWALLVLISADSRSNHLESFILDGFSWVFHPFAEHIPPRSWEGTMGI